mmetsp:Transcript_23212/g.66944  ORF Transcript_23212/g.66944 Transcript_23212/m.66944 type:complete len:210 (+) Transcript_23212:1060-1689(+)
MSASSNQSTTLSRYSLTTSGLRRAPSLLLSQSLTWYTYDSSAFRFSKRFTSSTWTASMLSSLVLMAATASAPRPAPAAPASGAGAAGTTRFPAAHAAAPVATQEAPSRPNRRGASPAHSRTSAWTAGMRLPPPTSSTASTPPGAAARASASASRSRWRMSAAAASNASRVKGNATSISGPSGPSGRKASSPNSASGSMLNCFRQWIDSL